jgi:hypothetical protein
LKCHPMIWLVEELPIDINNRPLKL